ncbi:MULTISPECIES: plastocyanin/azurin family copper-binding protein [unclassified Natrinema]|uniref:plastocyanin/azurin family copper-binding protein n=1 Tax=unclassified Natrinema TaxID=2622230 RepID=UPI00026D4D2C|nr:MULTISPECIES: plastocyanin/azurin family copper-binding protein [unclassified Natrinema]AFO55823.1 blue copper domain protein [Natrinema sp. J7-2]
MESDRYPTRRRLLQSAGLTAVTGILTECLDESTTDNDPGGSTDDGDYGEPETDGDDESAADGSNGVDEPGAEDETDGNNGPDADGSDGDAASDGNDTTDVEGETFELIDSETTIELRSLAQSWEGIASAKIEGVENSDFSLQEGETYTITWAENEIGMHNLEIYDDSESPVAGPTELISENETDLSVKFKASSDTVEYVCDPHYHVGMKGSIELE